MKIQFIFLFKIKKKKKKKLVASDFLGDMLEENESKKPTKSKGAYDSSTLFIFQFMPREGQKKQIIIFIILFFNQNES